MAGAKEIVAVEVDKKRVELIRENLRINRINNVIDVNKGVAEKPPNAKLVTAS
ncbi:hypothetical protein GWK48_11110 [Metallosphaera tengchongensis]|uniref:Uncharacterized protein n=1 Tax=Metallosphaera tengchongensis TaxID=1532350 RepID=A0A6N0NZ94_9CREN|nr:hypothetical protein [Metallosphaera tengchongensis]QKR00859.1 hypothetical protein GWK48_11110 [Metallosphaera tengchongensis]